jgi:cytosine deaminase
VLGCFAPMAPHLEPNLHRVFEAAERHGLALDFHADETHDTASQVLAAIARIAVERRFQAPIVVGHCSSLAMQDEAVIDRTLDQVAEAGLKIVSLPSCNLYLQDRRAGRTPRWRGVTLLHEMHARGIDVAIGSDNCRDPFHPYGDHDMLDTFRDAVRIAHLDHPVGEWPAAVTRVPASIMGATSAGLVEGDPADLVVFKARSFNELLSRQQGDRRIIRGGRFVHAPLPDYRELDPPGGDAVTLRRLWR